MTPGIYCGDVVHQRFMPRRHRLRYRIFQVLLDLDRLDDSLRPLRLMSYNRFNLYGFHDRDHGPDQDDRTLPLRARMIAMLQGRGCYKDGDRLFLLTMPRVLGFVFNPISLYFVTAARGGIRAVVYEVNNTFGDRHSYIMPVTGQGRHIHQMGEKRLHVSPFMDTRNMQYVFDLTEPSDGFCLNIRLRQLDEGDTKDLLFAGFSARRTAFSDAELWRLFWTLPLMTLKVIAGIHWEALRIVLKGIRLKPKPPTPRSSISVHVP